MARTATSKITPVSETIDLESKDMIHYPHVFVTFSYFTDSQGAPASTPSSGAIDISTRYNGAQGFTTLSSSPIDCSSEGAFADCAGPSVEFKAVPTGITGATHYQMTVTGDKG